MSALKEFGELAKKHRIGGGMTLRAFSQKYGFDPGNISKIERGKMPPPASTISDYAAALGLKKGTVEHQAFTDLAVLTNGRLPADLLDDEELITKLPVLLCGLRKRTTRKQLLDLAETIRRG